MADQPQIPEAKPVVTPAPAAANPAAQQAASADKARSGKVAVIAVHGVAYHKPGDSADAMAELLLSLPAGQPSAPRAYSPFSAETIHIPLSPVRTWAASFLNPAWKFTKERGALFADELRKWAMLSDGKIDRGRTGHEFSRMLLQDYKGAAAGGTFITNRLKGKRSANANGAAPEVHVYEAYWADLARPENTIGRFFTSVFQLLLHVGSLSRLAIEVGAGDNPGWLWKAFQKTQEWAVRILQLPIPVLNLILFVAALSVLPRLIPGGTPMKIAVLSFAAATGIGAGIVAALKDWLPVPKGLIAWLALPIAGAGILTAVAWFLMHCLLLPETLAALEWWIVGALLLKALLHKYAEIREGTRTLGIWLFVIAFLAFCVALARAPQGTTPAPDFDDVHLTQATMWTVQWILAALRTYWTFLFLWAIVACALGWWSWRKWPKGSPQRGRAHAAVRTSRLAIALPTLLMLLMIIFLWGGVFGWVTDPKHFNEKRPLFARVTPQPAPLSDWAIFRAVFFAPADVGKFVPRLNEDKDKEWEKKPCTGPCVARAKGPDFYDVTPNDYFAAALVWSIGPGLAAVLALMLIALFYMTWWVLPSVATERIPLRGDREPPRWSTNAQTLHLGSWHSRGLDAISVVTFFLWAAGFAVITLFTVAIFFLSFHPPTAEWPSWLLRMNGWSHSIIGRTSELTASIALLGLVVRYTSSSLGIVLDVDNYLRASPPDATPRAKIMERYVSVLRQVAQYKDPAGRGYDRLVIVAHSLGALISADLLRYLRTEGDAELASLGYGEPGGNAATIPTSLFTMGNPLRQLLNRFFPYLYDWVRDVPDGGLRPLGRPAEHSPATIPATALPDPDELGVAKWVSAYRSGDYVGRSVWLDEWYMRNDNGADRGTPGEAILIVPQDGAQPQFRSEMCIGEGAHQHYWDDTAPDIASQLDALICTP